MSNWMHALHAAHHEAEHGNSKLGAIGLIVIGFFFAPFLIGIPVLLYGFYKLFK